MKWVYGITQQKGPKRVNEQQISLGRQRVGIAIQSPGAAGLHVRGGVLIGQAPAGEKQKHKLLAFFWTFVQSNDILPGGDGGLAGVFE